MLTLHTPIHKSYDYIGLNSYFEIWEQNGWIKRILLPAELLPADRSFTSRIGELYICPEEITHITNYNYIWALQWRNNKEWIKKPNVFKGNWWVRDWQAYSSVQEQVPLDKKAESIFSGTIRGKNHVRNKWINSTEIWSSSPAKRYTKTNKLFRSIKDYYMALATTQFGLCLAGDCPVCQREIEVLGVGCVPIYTTGVEWDYYNKPIEGKHFLYCKSPEELNDVIEGVSEDRYMWMQEEGIKYFNENNSVEGMWNNLNKIIEQNNIKVD